jgi:response regulator of citrate/malate metabolism
MKILIIQNHREIAQAVARFLSFVLNINDVEFADLGPYEQRTTYEKAMNCDLILVDAFIAGESRGFQFAKTMEKKTLILFYAGEIDLRTEGQFWLILPYNYDRLEDKIKEIIEDQVPEREEYETLEERFPRLRERKGHHG